MKLVPSVAQPWNDPARYWAGMDAATAHLDPVFAALNLQALSHNAFDLIRRAGGKPIRVASKSVRVRAVLDAVLELPEYQGILAYSLREAVWLAESYDDIVVGYPSADRAAYAALHGDVAQRVTVMVDAVEQLDFIESCTRDGQVIRVCLELDASWKSRVLGHIGVYRSPVHSASAAVTLAQEVLRRKRFKLTGLMGYEAQVAGLGNAPTGQPVQGALIKAIQWRSMAELVERRSEAVRRIRELSDLEFVNGGGTGSLEVTAADPSVTELAAGSGLFGPHLFDTYAHFTPAPAAAFALPVVRRPAADRVTLLGGGWIASGQAGKSRLPQPVWPPGLKLTGREGAGEVQTPVTGAAARHLRVGDRVWMRHTKAGELSEHVNTFHIVDGDTVATEVPTYRGEGKDFL